MNDDIRTIKEALQSVLDENDGHEINPSNYNHDDACGLNQGYVNLWTGIEEAIKALTALGRVEMAGWMPISEAPLNGTPLAGYRTIRYLPYKPDGQRQMNKPGRWQEHNGHGWENCQDEPDMFQLLPQPTAPIESGTAGD